MSEREPGRSFSLRVCAVCWAQCCLQQAGLAGRIAAELPRVCCRLTGSRMHQLEGYFLCFDR